jgi:hypothetical protein
VDISERTEPMQNLTIAEAQRLTSEFLTGQMYESLKAVEYEMPDFGRENPNAELPEMRRARVEVRHVRGASDAAYLVRAFDDELLMQIQLNVRRFVVIYRIPAHDLVDAQTMAPKFEIWQRGATHAGWMFGWRDAVPPGRNQRYVETYCYATLPPDFLLNEPEQLFWRTDIVQMTRAFMLEAHRCQVSLSARQAGFSI